MSDVNTYDLTVETLAGDVRDALLGMIRDMKRPWPLLTEEEQREAINRMDSAAKHLVDAVFAAMTYFEFPRAVVELTDVKIKAKGVEAKITAANIEHNRNVLGDAVGDTILVLIADSEAFKGERGEPGVDADQPALPLDPEQET